MGAWSNTLKGCLKFANTFKTVVIHSDLNISPPKGEMEHTLFVCVCVWRKIKLTQGDDSRSSTTMSLIVALWFLPFSLGLRPKQVYSPPSSKVMFHSRMDMLLRWFLPTKSTRSRYMVTCGTTPSDGITESHTWNDQPAVNYRKGPLQPKPKSERSYLLHGAIVIVLPAEVESFDADAAGVYAGQQHRTAIHCLEIVDLSYRHFKGLRKPQT